MDLKPGRTVTSRLRPGGRSVSSGGELTGLPISVPALQPPCPSTSSRLRILKEVSGVDPGWVEIIPLKRVTVHVRTWLLSAQTGRRQSSDVRNEAEPATEAVRGSSYRRSGASQTALSW